MAQKAINNSKFIYVESDEIALELINEYAPEHLLYVQRTIIILLKILKMQVLFLLEITHLKVQEIMLLELIIHCQLTDLEKRILVLI